MLSLKQANQAVEFQRYMDDRHAGIFALALPHDGADLDVDAIIAFEQYAHEHPSMQAALNFLHEALLPVLPPISQEPRPAGLERLCGQ